MLMYTLPIISLTARWSLFDSLAVSVELGAKPASMDCGQASRVLDSQLWVVFQA